MAEVFHSACPLNCWDSCGLKVEVEGGKVTKVEGDEEHPITKGKICGRGRMLEQRVNSPERLRYPLKRVNGSFERISWEDALDEIAAEMKRYKQQYGSLSILHSHDYANAGFLTNLDSRFFNCFGGVTELIGSICWGAGIEAQCQDFGDAYSHAPGELFESRSIIVWGRNVARTNMHLYETLIEAKGRGAKLVVIDPIANATAKIADEYITVKPGFDGLLAAGILKELLRLHLEDKKFLSECSQGFEELRKLLESITLESISNMTEVPQKSITMLAKLYGNRPVSTLIGLGMQRYHNGGSTIRMIDAVVAASGNVGIAGGGANYANRQVGQSFHYEGITLPHRKKAHRTFTMMKQAEMMLQAKDPEIKMAFVTCGNPLTQLPNSSRAEKAFSSLEMLVVADSFLTDTAKLAHYVLPIAAAFETEDIYYSSMYHHYVNHGPKLVNPPGEAKTDAWIWGELAKRLGFENDFSFSREELIKMGVGPLQKRGISLERLRQEKFAELPVDRVPWHDHEFKTESGKFEFYQGEGGAESLLPNETKWREESIATMYPYNLLSIHPMRSNHSQHYHLLPQLPYVKVEISVDIAAKKDIKDGDSVRVWNSRGELEGIASILKQAHPNTINIDEGLSRRFGGTVNVLTPDLESDNGMGSTLYDCLVNLEKIC
ncbi:molybdopterin-dependent oxidoreductase [Bacillus massilinigeriensis]|uniref:molybdopterin-dependent oxidoreductase n=1 Tax=Bacillus mediterraneensis TaxID=1805474 RepID=UPI0008F9620F|nr:molybdopterin-dependent oxidoreductase [Bacillus mediterraneensis]